MKLFILISSIFFLSFQGDNTVPVKTDGFYVGKIKSDEYHFIYFHSDGNAETHILKSLNIKEAYAGLRAKEPVDFSGPYIIHAANIVYRSNNSANKTVAPESNLFHSYQGKMNSKGQLVLWVTSTDGSKTECTFDYYKFPNE
jgi:hypothetical protein